MVVVPEFTPEKYIAFAFVITVLLLKVEFLTLTVTVLGADALIFKPLPPQLLKTQF
jgi:hypothetical protein